MKKLFDVVIVVCILTCISFTGGCGRVEEAIFNIDNSQRTDYEECEKCNGGGYVEMTVPCNAINIVGLSCYAIGGINSLSYNNTDEVYTSICDNGKVIGYYVCVSCRQKQASKKQCVACGGLCFPIKTECIVCDGAGSVTKEVYCDSCKNTSDK